MNLSVVIFFASIFPEFTILDELMDSTLNAESVDKRSSDTFSSALVSKISLDLVRVRLDV